MGTMTAIGTIGAIGRTDTNHHRREIVPEDYVAIK